MMEFLATNFNLPTIIVGAIVFGGVGWATCRDVWQHTAAVVAHIPPEPVLRWAALLHDVGKPPCFSLGPDGVGHFYGHAARSTELADAILTRLRFDILPIRTGRR